MIDKLNNTYVSTYCEKCREPYCICNDQQIKIPPKMRKVSKEEYLEFFKKNKGKLKPISSFSDPDGIITFGYGRPAMDTDWGTEDIEHPLARSEMRKESRYDTEWAATYYLNN